MNASFNLCLKRGLYEYKTINASHARRHVRLLLHNFLQGMDCKCIKKLPVTAAECSSWHEMQMTFSFEKALTLNGVNRSWISPWPSFPPLPQPQENSSPEAKKIRYFNNEMHLRSLHGCINFLQ